LTQQLRALSQREGVTLFMTLLAAFKILLCRLSGQEDVVVGTPVAGRNRPEIEGVIGLFLNNLVLRTDLSGNPTFLELLRRVRETTLEAYDHQDLPFEKLLMELQPERDLSRTPLFQIFVNMHSVEALTLPLSGLNAEGFARGEAMSHFDLTAYILEKGEDIYLRFVYRVDLFDQARMAEMLAQFRHLLEQTVANPDQRISLFSLVTPTASATLPDPTQPLSAQWQGAIHAQFSKRARQMPDQTAVIDTHEQWTYEELEHSSNQLANCLRAKGIESQDIVAIYGQRSAALIWAVLGVLKAGAAFLILDPAYPAARLIDYLEQATARGWIQIEAAGALPDRLEAFVATSLGDRCIVLPQRSKAATTGFLAVYSTEDPSVPVGPDDLAYVAFTSGSAGKPKGVLGRHGPLTHFLPWQQEAFALTPADRFSMLSGLSHDPLQRDIFTALWTGATVCVPDNNTIGTPGCLADWMAQQSITFVHITPALGQILTETTTPGCLLSTLRYAFFVGDKLTSDDVERLRHLAPQATFINSFGSTETQRAVSYHLLAPGPQGQAARTVYPLGWGMPDVQLLVLNSHQRMAGVGELGEIYVRSPHLARGYLGDEALTQARFLTNPFTGSHHDRLYKTGDLGRYLPDGMVEILGRSDDQLKIRGFRIEPAEIEAVLRQNGGMPEAFVLAREDVPGDKQLVAYVVPGERTSPEASELRKVLRARLPEHMVPAAFVTLDRLPLTPNGKVDVTALPAPDWTRSDLKQTFVAPRTLVEEKLAVIWRQVLGLEEVGVHDSFFDLGGHSMLATRLIARVRDAFTLDLYLAAIFEAPTIARLAELVETMRWAVEGTTHMGESKVGEREEGEL
jgi:amino acid adenylation domain-containing protein